MKTVLVTGVNGFVGHHVAEQLHEGGNRVIGLSNQPELDADLKGIVESYFGLDLINPDEVGSLDLRPIDAIINLAGFAKVGDSRGQGELYNKVNIGVHTVLYDECLRQDVRPRIIAVSTGAVYDNEQPMPITETSPLVPADRTNEYVISKQLMEEAVLQYKARGLRCIITRPMNHTGPGQLPGFLIPDLGVEIEHFIETREPLKVGNLNTKRDYTDVRDVARAYIKLALCDEAKLTDEVYNICSGKSVAGRAILDMLAHAYGVENLETVVDPGRMRPNDVMDIYGSYDRLASATGWQPKISTEQMISDFVAWRKRQSPASPRA